ncbi:MAG: hypothetical protein HY000_02115 [Planctomycetes bacterium]|nr:hypothetical protein [Planctomycetota bacterium]
MTVKNCETEHDFTLVLDGIDMTPEAEDALFEAGCNDATISIRSGRVYMTFSRHASSLKDAITSAIEDVRKANIGASVLRVDSCNLVTPAEIARRIDRSRQLVHQYINGDRGPGNFPPPACGITDEAPLWYWCEVSWWLRQNDMITEHMYREAQDMAAINSVLELEYMQRREPTLTQEIIKRLGLLLAKAAPR